LAEYDFDIKYLKGGENMVADALSRMPDGEETFKTVAAVLTMSADPKISESIRSGYKTDSCSKTRLSKLPSKYFSSSSLRQLSKPLNLSRDPLISGSLTPPSPLAPVTRGITPSPPLSRLESLSPPLSPTLTSDPTLPSSC
jgi:hypothetical protein